MPLTDPRHRWMPVSALMLLVAGCSASELRGGGLAVMALGVEQAPDHDAERAMVELGTRAFLDLDTYGYFPGFDLRLGSSTPAGFVYDVALHPVGLGVWTTGGVLVGVQGGVGIAGQPPQTSAQVPIPASLLLAAQVTDTWHLALETEVLWFPWEQDIARDDRLVPIGDERRAALRVRVGDSRTRRRWRWGNGYHLGATLTERDGTFAWGIQLGYSLDVAANR